jgi:hypothetical protein
MLPVAGLLFEQIALSLSAIATVTAAAAARAGRWAAVQPAQPRTIDRSRSSLCSAPVSARPPGRPPMVVFAIRTDRKTDRQSDALPRFPTADDYAALAAFRGDMAVSMSLPTTPVSEETDVERIQLKSTFRVPNVLKPLVKVSDRFHLKPLLRSTTFCDAGYVLALADGGVTFADQASADTYGVADEVACRVVSAGGQVLSVCAPDMPEPGEAGAAILRYPIGARAAQLRTSTLAATRRRNSLALRRMGHQSH